MNSNITNPVVFRNWGFLLSQNDGCETSAFVLISVVTAALAFAIIFGHHSFLVKWRSSGYRGIPDGPKGLPIIGRSSHAKRFGDLYSLWLGTQLFVIISSPEIAKDLMVTNGSVFSSRKEMFLKSQTIFAGRGITATPYNDRWRKHRRIAQTWLHTKAVDEYTHILDMEATDMIKCLYKESQGGKALINPQPFAGRCSLNNMLSIVFGTRTDSVAHPKVARSLRISREFMNLTGPMSNLVDFVPLLQHLPTRTRSRARKLHEDLLTLYGESENLDDLDMAILASAFMIGGVETTASIMQWFFALIPAYPEIQRLAQADLDRVVGRDRLPAVEDEKNLPFCHAIVKEIERCHNPFWLGTPHVASEDFTYQVANSRTRLQPRRYLHDSLTSAESSNMAGPRERDYWMFGAGRRICPGMWVTEREIWLSVSRLIWAFNLESVPGHPIDLKEYDGLSGRSPMPFHIKLVPRHDNVENVLRAATAQADLRWAQESRH
ncbi:cytochrome P450 [Diaporthe sp. PMI_573]|nr:cytochrome P450 [Diaporthaceae sp. PMI_573]